jgi:hypothetical protein
VLDIEDNSVMLKSADYLSYFAEKGEGRKE